MRLPLLPRTSCVVTLLVLLSSSSLLAQDKPKVDSTRFPLTEKELSKLVNRQFTRIVSGETKAPNSSFASVDTKDGQLTLNGALPVFKNDLLVINARAAVTEGVSSLFTNSKSNASVSFSATYNFLHGDKALRYDLDERTAIKEAQDKIDAYYEAEIENLPNKKMLVQHLHLLLEDSVSRIDAKIATLDDSLRKGKPLTRKRQKEFIGDMDKLVTERSKVSHLRDSISELYSRFEDLESERRRLVAIQNDKALAKEEGLEALGVKLQWFSIGYRLLSRKFFLYDSLQLYASQSTKKEFVTHQLSVESNWFNWDLKPWECRVIVAGVSFQLDDNFIELDNVDVTESYTSKSGKQSRVHQNKYTGYVGDYQKDQRSVRLYGEVYQFVNRDRSIALHVYPEHLLLKYRKALTNLGMGLFFSFTDKTDKEGKAKINAELYCKLLDLNNNLEKKNYKFYERNDIGIRVAFPLTFNFNQ